MDPSVENVLIDLLLKNQTGISLTLKDQEAEIAELQCLDPSLGAWIDDFEISVIEILNAPDEYFQSRFPELEDFNAERRLQLAEQIIEHSKVCPKCIRRIAFDSEFKMIVDNVIDENRNELKQKLALTADDE